ncbi:hypothetical protein PHAVU_002G205700 [Phaseolus vulgaris]|uniref:Knottin scorpion toxin-like domain-containing protein n=1 Tax=Phaseolus vulgaris TaxID=3885 RepID=V7CNX7_PHAVU|nr:hypothetical protein PHAVU_002G205700g [Phaseolus vulgaris]ESW31063.1 hypothetical protein PHAVU_002G205700g [Phaseolus vulgaris]
MAVAVRSLLPLLAGILVIISLLVGTESRYGKTMEKSIVTDLAEVMKIEDTQTDVFCCFDNHIGSCNPETQDDQHCNWLCLQHPCEKGGGCKAFGSDHRCHCFC